MADRIAVRFAALRAENRAGLVAYVMGYDPDRATSLEILKALPKAGADVIELGFAFTDPMADGPSIQKAAQRALAAGASLAGALDLASAFRETDQTTPLVLMGYANPVEQMGAATFAERAAAAGVDGVIVVDLPPEEDLELRGALREAGVSLIRLATPTTDDARLPKVLDGVSGFLYYVAVTGVTGQRSAATASTRQAVERLKRATDLPVAIGFGVRDAASAAELALSADAVVVGSAFVDIVSTCVDEHRTRDSAAAVGAKVSEIAAAVRAARAHRT